MRERSAEHYRSIVGRILLAASRGMPLTQFLDEATRVLLEASHGGAVVVRLERWTSAMRYRAIRAPGEPFRFETERIDPFVLDETIPRESYWSLDAQQAPPIELGGRQVPIAPWARSEGFRSLALIPFRVDDRPCGVLQLTGEKAGLYEDRDVRLFEDLAEILGLSLTHHRVQWAFQERMKELTCLYGIAKIAERRDLSTSEVLSSIAMILPPGWQYPDDCAARIVMDGESCRTADFVESPSQCQSAPISINGQVRGSIDVVYTSSKPEMHEGPFLLEERSLINEVARQVAVIVERRRVEEEKDDLERQLLHSERLATIGKLTAGIAHELNEPLGSILGFAQIVQETGGLPDQSVRDMDRIVKAAFHAREIIKKLMFFGRQTPPGKVPTDLNQIVEDGIGLLDPQLSARKIRCERRLAAALPAIDADPGQLRQILVNLIVNAIQAMPNRGTLTIATEAVEGWVILRVEDTGIGMPESVLRQIFVPFFTTKDVGKGTGLGLSVVHGIVSAHGGQIEVESRVGHGSLFRVRFPAAGTAPKDDRSPDAGVSR
jgi:signal transduction histidine kinase